MHGKHNDRGEVAPVLLGIGVVVLVLAVVAGIFAATVGLSGIVGRGNAHITKNDSTNRIAQNSAFYDYKTDYDQTVNKIPIYAKAAATGDQAASINLTGLESHCLDVVGKYEALSGKYISKDFKDAGLPESLDPTACKG